MLRAPERVGCGRTRRPDTCSPACAANATLSAVGPLGRKVCPRSSGLHHERNGALGPSTPRSLLTGAASGSEAQGGGDPVSARDSRRPAHLWLLYDRGRLPWLFP